MKVIRSEFIEFESDIDFLDKLIEAVGRHKGQPIEMTRTHYGVHIFYEVELSLDDVVPVLKDLKHELHGPEENDRFIEALDYVLDLVSKLKENCEHFVNNGDKVL